MARVINMSQLDPEDLILDFGVGRPRLTIPGTTSAATMIHIIRVYEDTQANEREINAIREALPEDITEADVPTLQRLKELTDRGIEATSELDSAVLKLIQVRQPDVTETGMSSEQLGWFLGHLVSGFQGLAGEEADSPPSAPSRAKKASRPARTRSTRSSGSRAS